MCINMVHTALPGDKYKCSRCGSSHIDIYIEKKVEKNVEKKEKVQSCLDCGAEEKV